MAITKDDHSLGKDVTMTKEQLEKLIDKNKEKTIKLVEQALHHITKDPDLEPVINIILGLKYKVQLATSGATGNSYVETACTDGEYVWVNPFLLTDLYKKPQEHAFVILHEIFHTLLLHPFRGQKVVDHLELWPIAVDLEVNGTLGALISHYGRMNLTMPPGLMYDVKYAGWSAEEIFKDLIKRSKVSKCNNKKKGDGNEQDQKGQSKDQGQGTKPAKGNCSVAGHSGHDDEVEVTLPSGQVIKIRPNMKDVMQNKDGKQAEESKDRAEGVAQHLYEHLKQQGFVPGALEKLVFDLREGKVNWRQILLQQLQEWIYDDYAQYIDRKRIDRGIYAPAFEREMVDITVAIDSSGSISDHELQQFMSEIMSIIHTITPKVRVITCDAAIADDKEIEGDYETALQDVKVSRGGTDFRPVFERLKESNTKVLIYFTDGYGSFPDKDDVKCRTIWCVPDRKKYGTLEPDKFPFGQYVEMDL